MLVVGAGIAGLAMARDLAVMSSCALSTAYRPDLDLRAAKAIVQADRKAANGRDAAQSLHEAVQATQAWKAATAETRRALRHCVNTTIGQDYGGDWSQLSVWSFDASEECNGEDALFPHGYGQIADHLAKGLNMRLNAKVKRIDPNPSVTLADGQVSGADHVIVALPLAVLQSGDAGFGASLKPTRQRALDVLQWAHCTNARCGLKPPSGRVMWIGWNGSAQKTVRGANVSA